MRLHNIRDVDHWGVILEAGYPLNADPLLQDELWTNLITATAVRIKEHVILEDVIFYS